MEGVDWRFPALLMTAMLVAMVLSLFQARAYNRELNRASQDSRGAEDILISGRHRSFRGGAVVVLVIDRARNEIVRASSLRGFTVFARFRDRPQLLGPVENAEERAQGRAERHAMADALSRMPETAGTNSDVVKDRLAAARTRRRAARAARVSNGSTPQATALAAANR